MNRITASLLAAAMAVGVSSATHAADQLTQNSLDKDGRFLDVIVKLNVDARFQGPQNSRAMAADVARSHGADASHLYGAVFSGFAARVSEANYKRLLNDPMVEYVNFDAPVRIAGGNCPACGGGGDDGGGGGGQVVPWGIDRSGASTNPNTGAGVDVYIIDTGIDVDHADLNVAGGFASERCKGGGCSADWDDDDGHGTHVAGTVAALDNDTDVVGMAPGATLYAVKVLNNRGSGSLSGVIAGVDWVTQQVQASGRASAANMSLGGGGSKTGTCTTSGFSGSDAYHEAICNSRNAGVVYAVAAGNSGADAAGAAPAAFDDSAITVSATSSSDNWPSWSNWGNDSASWTSKNSAPVAIAAPGVSVLSTANGGGTTTLSGTSMASPHVAGAIALFLASSPQSADSSAFFNARSALLNSAESTAGFSNTSGNPHDEDFLDASGL